MLYTDSCSEWCWFALYCRRIYFEQWTSFITQFTHGERNETSRLRAVWGISSVMDHPIQALTAPILIWLCYILYIDIYIQMYSNWSVPGSAEQISRCSFWCVSIAIWPQVLTSPVVSEDQVGGQLLWSLLPFLRGWFTWIVASVSSARSHVTKL